VKVTCCIPCHNQAATLEHAVASAFDAGCERVMIANDGSTDNTQEVIERLYDKYYGADFRITTFNSWGVREGASVTRNHMINCPLTTELVICLDADDTLWDITALREAWRPGAWCYGNHNELNQGNDFGTLVKGVAAGSLSRKNITGISFLFAKEDWQRVGGFDVDFAFAEDWAFQCALTNGGVKPVYVDTTVYTRIMRSEGNERSVLAGEYWTFYRTMARRKYPNVFAGMG
jgi:glycosyltransferase involved in cell wall biosynthesis